MHVPLLLFLLKMLIFENSDGFFGVGPIVYALNPADRSKHWITSTNRHPISARSKRIP